VPVSETVCECKVTLVLVCKRERGEEILCLCVCEREIVCEYERECERVLEYVGVCVL